MSATTATTPTTEAAIVERMLREYGGIIPDRQLVEEIGLALTIHRRNTRKQHLTHRVVGVPGITALRADQLA